MTYRAIWSGALLGVALFMVTIGPINTFIGACSQDWSQLASGVIQLGGGLVLLREQRLARNPTTQTRGNGCH